jgi:hypothetical protein
MEGRVEVAGPMATGHSNIFFEERAKALIYSENTDEQPGLSRKPPQRML